MELQPTHPEDVFIWPDGTWCYRSDFEDCAHMSDDFVIMYEGTLPAQRLHEMYNDMCNCSEQDIYNFAVAWKSTVATS